MKATMRWTSAPGRFDVQEAGDGLDGASQNTLTVQERRLHARQPLGRHGAP
jgi:hypothetical protein